jgi:hypothetical protein
MLNDALRFSRTDERGCGGLSWFRQTVSLYQEQLPIPQSQEWLAAL